MLTSRSIRLVAIFTACLIIGLILGNHIMMFISLVPLSLIVTGLAFSPPAGIVLKDRLTVYQAFVNEEVEVKYTIAISRGLGSLTVHQEIPPFFVLVNGNNLRVFWKSWHPRSCEVSFRIRCTKRGVYPIPPLKYEANHGLRLMPTRAGVLGEAYELTVQPKIMNIRHIRGLPGIATSPFPVIDQAKIGVATTDFREIRKYVYGDPVKNINWKATARLTNPDLWPLTNEYEVEGKKSVWLFLDASSVLEVGNDIENVFEYCLEGANSIAYYFLDHGYRVGMYVFNNRGQLFFPDAGKKQFLKISKGLMHLAPVHQMDEFSLAVEKCRRYILGYNPLCVILTRLDSRNSDNILLGVKKLRALRGRQKRKLPVMVIHVPGYRIVADHGEFAECARTLSELNTRPRVQHLRNLGSTVMEWNPRRETFSASFFKMVKTRRTPYV
jgi:uncharacterized protein (DUF58 family)